MSEREAWDALRAWSSRSPTLADCEPVTNASTSTNWLFVGRACAQSRDRAVTFSFSNGLRARFGGLQCA